MWANLLLSLVKRYDRVADALRPPLADVSSFLAGKSRTERQVPAMARAGCEKHLPHGLCQACQDATSTEPTD
jgi:hypothetical protein